MNLLFSADVSIANVIGGAERVLFEQTTRLTEKGHQVHILTRKLPSHDDLFEDIHGVREYRYLVNMISPMSFLLSTMRNGTRLFESCHKDYKYSCITSHQPFSAYAVLRSSMARHVKKIYICHSLAFEEYISRSQKSLGLFQRIIDIGHIFARKWIESNVLKLSDKIIVLSRYTQDKLHDVYRINPQKIDIIPGGVDLIRFRPIEQKEAIRQKLGLPTDRVLLLTIRNLVNRMGLENLILCIDRVRQKIPEIFLVIGGEGPLKAPLMEMTRKLNLDHHILFAGFIPEEILPDYYSMSDLFVLPSIELEGFGLVTLEAMSSGVPVLGTPVGGTKEILGQFDPNFLFINATSSAMADRIESVCRTILGGKKDWAEIKRQCRRFVEMNYGWERHIDALEALMKES